MTPTQNRRSFSAWDLCNQEEQGNLKKMSSLGIIPPSRIFCESNTEELTGLQENIELRKYNSLPPCYKHRKRACLTLKDPHPKESGRKKLVDPDEFQSRLSVLKDWMNEFSDVQKLALLQGILPVLGPNQLHWLDTQVPGSNPGLHYKCPPGCSDPLQIVPPHLIYKIFGLLDPFSLAAASRVSWVWHHYSVAPSLWKNLCSQAPWKLSRKGSNTQIQRFGGEPDWRCIFVERYKLRRSWLAGQCHVRTFQVWNTKTNSPWSVMTLTGHSGEVRCLHLQENKLVSGSTDLTIKVWDLDTHQDWSSIACRVTMVGHTDTVRCVQMDLKKNLVISGSYDTTLKVWNLQSGVCLNTLRGHSGPVLAIQAQRTQNQGPWTNSGSTEGPGSGTRLISGSADKTVRIWSLDTGICEGILYLYINVKIWSLDTGICEGILYLYKNVKIWSLDTGICEGILYLYKNLKIWSLDTGICEGILYLYINVKIWSLDSGICEGILYLYINVKIWSLDTGICEGILEGHKDAVTCLTIDSSEVKIITGSLDRTIKVWSISSLDCLRTLDWMSSEGHTGVIRCLQADEWRIISAADDKTIKVWDLNTGRRLVTLKSHSDGVTCLQFNDFYIVSGSYDKTVKLWDFTVC
ncbi:F-box/WD repeat-containing protein 7 [Eurytemora carolleeae]|uniref:F-box/WD repeat-containing protein 7 n=1 Tax=Eurytemora carolleeae TaxID=1294199 RepID=UPI000C76BCFE|nr:F-box/WD repeat-containing protein 7 [Eurytemora carolleeae]|eukprot:XP_023321127.1 F-box/WD repeat-containing protein 7-like [Eurytemora affinis]